MFGRRVLLFLLVVFLSVKVRAEVFTVTSNADNGPGTLREVLTLAAANGSAEKDFIYFNLPDLTLTGRTITIFTNLPGLSSNLVVDGTTQPGLKFGVSDAKVQLVATPNANTTMIYCFNIIEQHDVGIYGLMMDIPPAFYNKDIIFQAAIFGKSAKHITIGAPGKGNIIKNIGSGIFFDLSYSETDLTISESIKISSNILGLNEDGETKTALGYCSLHIERAKNVVIGGNTVAERNVVVGDVIYDETTYVDFNVSTGNLLVANNFIGLNYSGNKVMSKPDAGNGLFLSGYYLKTVDVINNVMVGRGTLSLTLLPCFFRVIGNKFGTDVAGAQVLGTHQTQIVTGYCNGGGIVGGPTAADQNIFAGAYTDNPSGQQPNNGVIVNIGSPRIEIVNNIFKCNNASLPYWLAGYSDNQGYKTSDYYATVEARGAASVSGIASPNSRVDLYYGLTCTTCEPEEFFKSVIAGADGKWVYNGVLKNNSVIAAATLNGSTSQFTTLNFTQLPSGSQIKPACNGNNGSITGLAISSNASYSWYNEANDMVGTTLDLSAPPGKYHLVATDGFCSIASPVFEIIDAGNQINASGLQKSSPSCGNTDGGISGITASPISLIEWKNAAGALVGSNIDLTGVPAGSYTLTVYTQDRSCSQTYGPITLTNATAPVIVESSYTTTPSNCNSATGIIKGVYATGGTGTLQYSWRNAQDQEVGTSPELTGAFAGKYRLRVNDGTSCPPVYSSEIEILESNGVSLDRTGQGGVSPSCNRTNGSITGLSAPGATTYEWTITNTATNVGHNLDLTGVPAGNYTLTISNTTCSKSYPFEVAGFPPTVFTGITYTKTKTCESYGNGTITLNTANANEEPYQYLWFDEQGNTVGYTKEVQYLKAGNYHLQLINNNYCPYDYPGVFTIEAYPKLEIKSYGTVTNATCGVGTGSVTATEFKGGSSNYTYQWLDENGTALPGETNNFINNLAPGKYTLHLTDGTCIPGDVTYTVKDIAVTPPAPSADNIRVYNAGKAIIKINNPFPTAIYRLYESANSPQPIKDTIGGNISISVTESRSYYVSLTYGYCESARTEVKVFLSALTGDIVNTFTPNGDGINDYWVIKGLDTYPDATVKIFNRYGSSVFESVGYAKPFDGNRNGKPLPAGVYYYIINLKRGDVLSGNITIIR